MAKAFDKEAAKAAMKKLERAQSAYNRYEKKANEKLDQLQADVDKAQAELVAIVNGDGPEVSDEAESA